MNDPGAALRRSTVELTMAQAIVITLEKDLPDATAAYAKSGFVRFVDHPVQ